MACPACTISPCTTRCATPDDPACRGAARTRDGFAADGYARATGRPGVAITTTGTGATNALTAIGEAWSDLTPVVLIASHIESPYVEQERGFGHELRGQLDLFQTATRFRTRPHAGRRASGRRSPKPSLSAARSAAGPVIVQIPQDVLNGTDEVDYRAAAPGNRGATRTGQCWCAPRRKCSAGAREPAIYAGVGVHGAGAHAELLELAELLDAPVFTTAQGKGAFRKTIRSRLATVGPANRS